MTESSGGGVAGTFDGMDLPRIRHITGIRIHQLTLPESLAFASKLQSSPEIDDNTPLAGPSSPVQPSFIRRNTSYRRQRSTSTSTVSASPLHPGRARAPTLAGEALEHVHEPNVPSVPEDEGGGVTKLAPQRRLARCFVVLKEVARQDPDKSDVVHPGGPTSSSSAKDTVNVANGDTRPSLASSGSQTSIKSTESRKRDSGYTTPTSTLAKITLPNGRTFGKSTEDALSNGKGIPLVRSNSQRSIQFREGLQPPRRSSKDLKRTSSTQSQSPSLHQPGKSGPPEASIPFFVSAIHHPSTNPRFVSLEPEDFAPWLSTYGAAANEFEIELWYEDGSGSGATYKRLKGVGGRLDMLSLKKVDKNSKLQDNTVLLNIGKDSRDLYYIPEPDEVESPSGRNKRNVRGILERSLRETRMKRSAGIGALHQLVNMQAFIADTQRSIQQVQAKIDHLIQKDADLRAIKRTINMREERVDWMKRKVKEVEEVTEEVAAKTTLNKREIGDRRSHLGKSEERDDLLRVLVSELEDAIATVETDRASLIPAIHLIRAQHVQTLDSLFPIQTLHPPSLLYSILSVPLPIPTGAKDPAPPLTLTLPQGAGKVDERTTAAALGYVAMVVQQLGNLAGSSGMGLGYPVTCAGSRSLVKDVVSVMQGPRSFPLYAKGVERYRYEYAVFLLNKNIEMLMQDANIRLLDLRHTLPNLKALLLTMSSPVPPDPIPHDRFISSRASSRQTSQAYSISLARGLASPHSTSASNRGGSESPAPAPSPASRLIKLEGSPSPSPLASIGVGVGRRSRLARTSSMVSREVEIDLDSDSEGDPEKEDLESVSGTGGGRHVLIPP